MKTMMRIAASVLLLAIAAYLLDWDMLLRTFSTLSPVAFCIAVLISACQYFPMAYRWFIIVRVARPGSFLWHLQYFSMGTFLNTFTPANIGGDVYRFMKLRREGRRYFIFLALFRERLVGLQAYLTGYLVFWAVYVLSGGERSLVIDLLAAAIAIAQVGLWGLPVIIGYGRSRGWFESWGNVKAVVDIFWRAARYRSAREFMELVLLSIVALAIWCIAILYLANVMEIQIQPVALGIVVVLAELIRLIPVSVQGIGLREGAYAYVFTLLGASGEAGFALAAVGYLALTVSILLMGVLGALLNVTGPVRETGRSKLTQKNPESHH